jgi:hypothetical protein
VKKKIILKKMSIFGLFGESRLWTPRWEGQHCGGADGNFMATYLKIGVDIEFDIKTATFYYTKLKTCGS